MSYILEALKKAEAERQGGAQQAALPPVFASSSSRRTSSRPRWLWIAVPALALSAVAATWWTLMQEQRPATALAQAPAAPALALPPPPDASSAPIEEPAKPAPKPREKPVEKRAEKKASSSPVDTKAEERKQAQPEQRVLTLRELPEHIQREIPPLSVGGYIYSGNKADRSVLINKRLLREGDEAAPGLTLESMQPNGMVFVYKGYRYRTGY